MFFKSQIRLTAKWYSVRSIWADAQVYPSLHLFESTLVRVYTCSSLHLFESTLVRVYTCSSLHFFESTLVRNCTKFVEQNSYELSTYKGKFCHFWTYIKMRLHIHVRSAFTRFVSHLQHLWFIKAFANMCRARLDDADVQADPDINFFSRSKL